jgi:hypothetical protein
VHHRQTLSLLARLTASSGRQEIVRELAHHLGGEDLTVLILDSETGTWSPAFGLTPVVRFGDDLHAFIANCHQASQHTGTLALGPDRSTRPAIGILAEDRSSLLILLVCAPCTDDLNEGRLILPLLVADLGKQVRSARVDRSPRKDGSLDERPLPAALRRAWQEADRLTGNLALAERSMQHAALILSNAHADRRQRRTADHCRAAKTREANLNETPRALAEANLVPEHGLRSLAQRIAEMFISFCAIRFLSEDGRWLNIAAAGHHDRTLLAGISPLFSTPERIDGDSTAGYCGRTSRY